MNMGQGGAGISVPVQCCMEYNSIGVLVRCTECNSIGVLSLAYHVPVPQHLESATQV